MYTVLTTADTSYISWDTAVWIQPHAKGNVESRQKYKWTVGRIDDNPDKA